MRRQGPQQLLVAGRPETPPGEITCRLLENPDMRPYAELPMNSYHLGRRVLTPASCNMFSGACLCLPPQSLCPVRCFFKPKNTAAIVAPNQAKTCCHQQWHWKYSRVAGTVLSYPCCASQELEAGQSIVVWRPVRDFKNTLVMCLLFLFNLALIIVCGSSPAPSTCCIADTKHLEHS